MADYLITFTGYIDERKRPENFPRTIQDIATITVNNQQEIVDFVNNRCAMYTKNHGMGVRLDPHAIEELGMLDTNRAWVPMHMVTYLTATLKPITGESPMLNEQGETVMPSGATLVKQ